MAQYMYPAIFTKEGGMLSVSFPDIPGCFASSDNLQESFTEATDALSVMLCHLEEQQQAIPKETPIESVHAPEGSFVSYVFADTTKYRRSHYSTKSVKKTLSIPAWMNEAGTAAGLNYSQLLQDAIQRELGTA